MFMCMMPDGTIAALEESQIVELGDNVSCEFQVRPVGKAPKDSPFAKYASRYVGDEIDLSITIHRDVDVYQLIGKGKRTNKPIIMDTLATLEENTDKIHVWGKYRILSKS